ncbi:hypothetical protein SPHINGO8BC_50382 [Sphingobacterium multivorum]|uniref:Uncharacterized protein n=1 Tax=Sphingobacterium multivorum TaxID=28454 RepID=A0A654BV52_SPHMU|nr:hypothetical protein SPHINGO8BC_50382 [Sphingobacterium multivorum]
MDKLFKTKLTLRSLKFSKFMSMMKFNFFISNLYRYEMAKIQWRIHSLHDFRCC